MNERLKHSMTGGGGNQFDMPQVATAQTFKNDQHEFSKQQKENL